MAKILVLYYSTYGHVEALAEAEAEGAREAGADVTVKRIPETLSDEVRKKMHAKEPNAKHEVATPAELAEYDGILIGAPTRFGMAAAQVKAFLDATGGLWQAGKLVGKAAGTFVSTGTQNGGQETTHLTFITQFVHHGMVYVPLGYRHGEVQFDMGSVHGGSPYGASTLAGADGSRKVSDAELAVAKVQGKSFAEIAAKLAAAAGGAAAAAK
eukprot:CAMPEP_0198316478 /NCGR_PEP_ID=MMETSP1450-20131203/6356_1 /TAXON_ID=753684 ORGANISM="Madagascaria erythrocladiodes, Strain CCMP3234" /NCGR_SAMPLE_ID=MMETSP1450 /ASSEMBLY_ACC=CAM_ASM_001115 /LENGTH=211 /DNA_ID=CAMNT_0044019637 /DNA_START=113 /DNA_END=748 /DNA_ORIENTATION=+